jgi:hypothetical protein
MQHLHATQEPAAAYTPHTHTCRTHGSRLPAGASHVRCVSIAQRRPAGQAAARMGDDHGARVRLHHARVRAACALPAQPWCACIGAQTCAQRLHMDTHTRAHTHAHAHARTRTHTPATLYSTCACLCCRTQALSVHAAKEELVLYPVIRCVGLQRTDHRMGAPLGSRLHMCAHGHASLSGTWVCTASALQAVCHAPSLCSRLPRRTSTQVNAGGCSSRPHGGRAHCSQEPAGCAGHAGCWRARV